MDNRDVRMLRDLRSHVVTEAMAVDGQCAAGGDARRVRRLHDDGAEAAHLFLEHADGILEARTAKRVAADELGKASRLMGRRRFCGAHLVERDLCALLGGLPGGFTASQASADYDAFLHGFS